MGNGGRVGNPSTDPVGYLWDIFRNYSGASVMFDRKQIKMSLISANGCYSMPMVLGCMGYIIDLYNYLAWYFSNQHYS